jgi:hypothetical protein
MGTWILIIYTLSGTINSVPGFASKDACYTAMTVIDAKLEHTTRLYVVCVNDGGMSK